jgi:hypothetical protein
LQLWWVFLFAVVVGVFLRGILSSVGIFEGLSE